MGYNTEKYIKVPTSAHANPTSSTCFSIIQEAAVSQQPNWSCTTVWHLYILSVVNGGLPLLQLMNYRWTMCVCLCVSMCYKDTRCPSLHSCSSHVLQQAPGQGSTCTAGSYHTPSQLQASSCGMHQNTHTHRYFSSPNLHWPHSVLQHKPTNNILIPQQI